MAKKNNTTLLVVLAVAAFFLLSNNPTGNYISDYHASYDVSKGGCPLAGKMDCYYEPTVGWWTRECVDGRWSKAEFCGTLRQYGDVSCGYHREGYGDTVTKCQNPVVPKENTIQRIWP